MQPRALLAAGLVLAASLPAQSPTIKVITGTDYSMVADNGAGEVIDGVPANTTLGLPFQLQAKSNPGASASHKTEAISSGSHGKGIRIRESASGSSHSSTGSIVAGTLDEYEQDHHEPHVLIVWISGTTLPSGIVTISWKASASAGNALAHASIDLNGDLAPDFLGAAGGQTTVASYWVNATPAGFFFRIETHGAVEIEGKGSGKFDLDLSVWFEEASTGTAIGGVGPRCAGRLDGSASDAKKGKQTIELELSEAHGHAVGALVLGTQPTSVALGGCDLLVAPVVALAFRADGGGKAKAKFEVPTGFPLFVLAQDVLVWQDGPSLRIGTSNALKVDRR